MACPSPEIIFPAPPLPVDLTGDTIGEFVPERAAGPRERERWAEIFPTPPRPEECYI